MFLLVLQEALLVNAQDILTTNKNKTSPNDLEIEILQKETGWWFQAFFIFTPTWGRFPF